MGHLYHGELLVITRGQIQVNFGNHLQSQYGSQFRRLSQKKMGGDVTIPNPPHPPKKSI